MRARWQGTPLTRSLGQPSRPPYYFFVCPHCSILHWQKGRNASRGVQILGCHIVLMFFPTWWLAHLAHLWATGGAGNRTGLSRCRCWARTRWAACWADAGQPWQDVSRCPRAPTRCWAWAVFDQDQRRDSSPQPPLHLYHQKGLLSHHHLLLVLNSSLNHYLAQTCINKSDFHWATSSAQAILR